MYSNASNSQLLKYQGPMLYVCGAQPIKLIVMWLVPDRVIKENHEKIARQLGLIKTKFFSKRNQPTYAFCALIRFFVFFFGKKKFFCYKKEHKSPFCIVYIVSCSIIFARCCWSIHSKVVRLGKDAHSKQKSHSYTISSVIPQVYAHALHIVWYDPISETACMQRWQKN